MFENKINLFRIIPVHFLSRIDTRTYIAGKNIFISLILKGFSVLISFLLVPLTINYLNAREYGVWLTLSSILTWINYFDIGLANGLRNKLAEVLVLGRRELARTYVSTTFALLTIFMLLFFVVFSIANNYLHWDVILNFDVAQRVMLKKLVFIIFTFFSLQFIFKTVGTIFVALQKPAYNDLINLLGNFFSLIIIYVLTQTTNASLSSIAITFSIVPLVVYVLFYFLMFFGKYQFLRPKLRAINFKYSKNLIGLGFQFFVIQLAVCIVIYSSTNIVLVQMFGSESVTVYNIAYKYFNALTMVYMIIIMPFWSASTDAYTRSDFLWIKKSLKRLTIIFFISVIVVFLMVVLSNIFFELWVGGVVEIPITLSIVVAVYTLLFNWSNTFIYFINGIGKIRLQLYTTLIVAILYIPFTIYLGYLWGMEGVVIASVVSLIPTSILMPIQCKKLYSGKAKGIWNK